MTRSLPLRWHAVAVALVLTENTDGFHAGRVIDNWMSFYNSKRSHSVLGGATPDEAYGLRTTEQMAA